MVPKGIFYEEKKNKQEICFIEIKSKTVSSLITFLL